LLRQGALAALVCLAIVGLTGCGGGKKPATTVRQNGSATVASAIKSRLTAAGYTIEPLSLSGRVSPKPTDSFKVEVDFSSPRSFTLAVVVFRSPGAAALFEQKAATQCNKIVSCKRLRSEERAHTRQRVVGAAAYSAYTDYPTATLPVRDFEKAVALASGRASAR
jgi:hypothetical protein